jgi:hypothetical protein
MIVVSDTSVITSLLHIGREHLLAQLHGAVLIPPAVHQDLLRAHLNIPAFLEVHAVHDLSAVARLRILLDPGEAEAIVLAKETRADLLLIDEKLGRQIAVQEGLRIAGLLGLCVDAKRAGKISSLRELVQKLELEAGFRVSRDVKEQAFLLAGE